MANHIHAACLTQQIYHAPPAISSDSYQQKINRCAIYTEETTQQEFTPATNIMASPNYVIKRKTTSPIASWPVVRPLAAVQEATAVYKGQRLVLESGVGQPS